MSSSGFSFSGWLAGVPSIFAGRQYIFNRREQTCISVREEQVLAHSGGAACRARCSETGMEFDLRRLRIGAEEGGLVTLAMLESLECQAQLAVEGGSHPHVTRCHASLVDNIGTDHCRLLLCDPCCVDLHTHVKVSGGALGAEAVAELGQQLSLGLRHLHSLDILCGTVTSHGVLLGCDGKWKLLGELSAAAFLPCSIVDWRARSDALSHSRTSPLPPEARIAAASRNADSQLSAGALASPALDLWMLGALMAMALEGVDDRGIGGARAGNAILAASQEVLLCPLASRLWMLLHWLLATEPLQRPWSRRLVEVLHSIDEWWPQDLLIEMPEHARFHCQGMATAAARRLAFSSLGGMAAKRSCAMGLPLEMLRQSLADPTEVDRLCQNCALELGEFPATPEDGQGVPDLLPVLCAPTPARLEDFAGEKEDAMLYSASSTQEDAMLYSAKPCSPSSQGFQTDESTDEGSASGDDSTFGSDRGFTRRRLPSWLDDDSAFQ